MFYVNMTDMKHISLCLILELMLLFSFVGKLRNSIVQCLSDSRIGSSISNKFRRNLLKFSPHLAN